MNKLLILAGAIIVLILAIITTVLGLLGQRQTTQTGPVPTIRFPGSRGPNTSGGRLNNTTGVVPTVRPLTSAEKQKALTSMIDSPYEILSTEEKDDLGRLQTKLPAGNDNFEMRYSPELKRFFVGIKRNPEGFNDLKSFLRENRLLETYEGGSEVFIVKEEPLENFDEIVEASRQGFLDLIEESHAENYLSELEKNQAQQNQQSQQSQTNNSSQNQTTNRYQNNSQSNQSGSQTGGQAGSPGGSSGGGNQVSQETKQLTDFLQILLDFDVDPAPNQTQTEENQPPTSEQPSTQIGSLTLPPNLGERNSLGYYQMPNSPSNEYVFNGGTCSAQRWGKRELVGVIYTVALQFKAKYPGSLLRVGDLNASGHKSHKWGYDVDITTSDRSAANTSGSRERSIEFGKMFMNSKLVEYIFYNDTAVQKAVNSYARQNNLPGIMQSESGHADHFHLRLKLPKGPVHTPGC